MYSHSKGELIMADWKRNWWPLMSSDRPFSLAQWQFDDGHEWSTTVCPSADRVYGHPLMPLKPTINDWLLITIRCLTTLPLYLSDAAALEKHITSIDMFTCRSEWLFLSMSIYSIIIYVVWPISSKVHFYRRCELVVVAMVNTEMALSTDGQQQKTN